MKIYGLVVLQAKSGQSSTILSSAFDLSSFSFYQKGSVQEFMNFFSKTVAERTEPGQRQSVQEKGYTAHVYNRGGPESLVGVMIVGGEYPLRPAFSLLSKVLDEFSTAVPQASYGNPSSIQFPQLATYLEKYQDPKQADAIMKVQAELDETKIILHKTIEGVLERGTKLDDLVERSGNLSASTKMFYKSAKKQNSCCVIM
ncbi:vesicle membrane protein [Clavulina sp. PMI_390]|nr:vesicle membrane protein [Clavulina sp. PMI_390]